MTRVGVYSAALVAFVAATAMTLASILTPNWVSYSVSTASGGVFSRSVGLHRSCSSVADPPCRPFPSAEECGDGGGEGRHFCSAWRTTGFLMNLAAVAELAALVGFLVTMAGGRAKREAGWRVVATLLVLVAAAQLVAVAIVAYLFDNNDKFLVPGWRLDTSWVLCTVSASVALLSGLGLAVSAFALPPEDGYEFLADPAGV